MIYLDHNATTPMLPEAYEVMAAFLREEFGNASSVHRFGAAARAAVETARHRLAARIGARPAQIVFTSGGTESNNAAIFGALGHLSGARLVVSPIEHWSVLAPVRELARRGARVTWLPVDGHGRVDPRDVAAAIEPDAALVSIGWANNEIGTVQDIASIGAVCRARGVPLHVDAAQALGRVEVDVAHADLCSFSAHKLGGPKGVGALYVGNGARWNPLLVGGSQERGRRAGTENVAGIAAFGVAAERYRLPEGAVRLRESLWEGLISRCGGVRRNSPPAGCLANTLNVSFAGVRGETLVAALDLEGVAVSVGSACAAGAGEPSHVLRALGRGEDEARDGVRFSLGAQTTEAEIAAAVDIVARVVRRARGVAPLRAGAAG